MPQVKDEIVGVGHFPKEHLSHAEEVVGVPGPRSPEHGAVFKVTPEEPSSRVEEFGDLAPRMSEQIVDGVVDEIEGVPVPPHSGADCSC